MNKRRSTIFITAAVTAFAAGMGFGMWENQNRVHYEAKEAPPRESAAPVSGTAVPTQVPTETEAYLLRYVGDRTVVYKILSDGSSEMAFAADGVRIDMLPDSEREKLKNGIRFDSEEKLYGAIENYSS